MWPSAYVITCTQCAIGVRMGEGPIYVMYIVAHVLGVSKFEYLGDLCVTLSMCFPYKVGAVLVHLFVGYISEFFCSVYFFQNIPILAQLCLGMKILHDMNFSNGIKQKYRQIHIP